MGERFVVGQPIVCTVVDTDGEQASFVKPLPVAVAVPERNDIASFARWIGPSIKVIGPETKHRATFRLTAEPGMLRIAGFVFAKDRAFTQPVTIAVRHVFQVVDSKG
jgi:hypothetical protein